MSCIRLNRTAMKKRSDKIFAAIGAFLALILLIIISKFKSPDSTADLYAEVQQGSFEITVDATGELIPEKSLEITGPLLPTLKSRGRGRHSRVRASDLKITDLVPEGTLVNKGDFIAELDRTTFDNTLKDEIERLEDMQANLQMKLIDSAVVLTNLRNEIKNQIFTVEESQIVLEKSRYEPPATIRQAEIELDKAHRKLKQLIRQYNLKKAQKVRELINLRADITNQTSTLNDIQTYLAGFTITAPASGMVIYKRNRDGTKRKTGSTVNAFDMVIATLPDLSTMISKTHVSEIDVSKVKAGQKVNIKVDAYPDNNFTGRVIRVAKIGEQLPNSDSKMFEVQSRIEIYDSRLRPSMTTSNKIIIKSFENVVYIPLECVHTESDGISFVYTKDRTKQVVRLGESDDKFVIIDHGLEAGTAIYRYTPENPDSFIPEGQNLTSELIE